MSTPEALLEALARELDRLQISDEFSCTPLGTDGRLVLLAGNVDASHAVYVATELLTALQACPVGLTPTEFWDLLRPRLSPGQAPYRSTGQAPCRGTGQAWVGGVD